MLKPTWRGDYSRFWPGRGIGPNTRVQRTRSSPSALRSPLTRRPLGGEIGSAVLVPRCPRLLSIPIMVFLAVASLASTACTSVAYWSISGADPCAGTFQDQLASVLVEQGGSPRSPRISRVKPVQPSLVRIWGRAWFLVSSPSGADYTFLVQRKHAGCLLRLYGRQKGFVRYTNNLTYISTRALAGCNCAE